MSFVVFVVRFAHAAFVVVFVVLFFFSTCVGVLVVLLDVTLKAVRAVCVGGASIAFFAECGASGECDKSRECKQ